MTSPSLTASKNASSLESLLRPTHFVSELRSRKKAQALDELAAALATAGVTRSPEIVAELLREREALGSTGVGKGIAVPHARSTLIADRAVLVARSQKGIDFDATDGAPVHLVFLVVAPIDRVGECVAGFEERGLVAAEVGVLDDTGLVRLSLGGESVAVFDLNREPLTGLAH